MADFLVDSFTDADGTVLSSHTGETGATWTRHLINASGDIRISNANRARGNIAGAAMSLYYASGDPVSSNYYIEAPFYAASVPGSGYAGLAGRVNTAASTFYWAIYNFAAGRWELWRSVAGTGTLLGSYSQTLTSTSTYTLRLRMVNSAISLWVDGVSRVAVTDTNVGGVGRAGLVMYGAWSNSVGLHATSISADAISQLIVVGDSVAAGLNATTAPNEFRNLLATDLGVAVSSAPIGGTQIADQCSDDRSSGRNQVFFTSGYTPADIWVWMTGYNDMRYFGTDADGLEAYKRILTAALSWIARQPADIKQGSSADWTYSGTWTSVTVANIGTKYANTSGATATLTFSGNSVTVGYVSRWGLADGGTFTVKVDGSTVGTIDANFGENSGYGSGSLTRYALMAVRYDGFSSGSHTLEIAATSAGTVQIAFACGPTSNPVPEIRVAGPLKMNSTGYTSNSPYNQGSDAAVALYAATVKAVARGVYSDGGNVRYVDVNNYFNIANLDTDNVHPTNTGHGQIRDAFMNTLPAAGFNASWAIGSNTIIGAQA